MMYLNTCSHGLPRARTLHRMAAHLAREAELGEARAAADVAPELAQAQKDAAEVMAGADADVGFAFTTTQIWTHVLTCLARPGARVLLCDWEWGAHLRFAEDLARRTGVVLDILPAQDALDPEAWAERIDGDLALIAAPLVTSVTGQMLPAAQIAALPRPEHTLTLLDAAQGLGRVPMDQAGAWDIVAATSRKWLRAPRQTALMRLSPRAAAALGAEAGGLTGVLPNIPLRLGLADALAAFRADPPFASIEAQDTALRTALAPTGWVQPKGAAGTVTLAVPEDRRPGIAAALAAAGMEAKWCTPTMDEPRAPWPEGHAALRLSPLPDTSPDTLEAVIPPLQAALAR